MGRQLPFPGDCQRKLRPRKSELTQPPIIPPRGSLRPGPWVLYERVLGRSIPVRFVAVGNRFQAYPTRCEHKPLFKRAGLDGFTFHALRHTFATALFSRGEHPKRVQSLLGHSSITQTMDTYSHVIDDIGSDAVGGLDDAFRL